MAFKPIDPKRDEFRRYLERAGVIEALTKVFVRVIKERPDDPMEYLRNYLGDTLQEADNYEFMRNELDEARVEIKRLRSLIEKISPEIFAELENEKQNSPQIIDSSAVSGNQLNTQTVQEGIPDRDPDNNKENTTEINKNNIQGAETNSNPSSQSSIAIDNKHQ